MNSFFPKVRGIRLTFQPNVPVAELADTVELARLTVESLYGPERVAVELRYTFDRETRCVPIGTSDVVGRSFAIVLLGFVRREFGAASVRIGALVDQEVQP
jgi:hypothetical protein